MEDERLPCPSDCRWRIANRWQKCSCCRRNRHMKDNYETNSKAGWQDPAGKDGKDGKTETDQEV